MAGLLDHIDLRVRDRGVSTRFYDAILGVLGAVKEEGPEWTTWRIPADGAQDGWSDNFGIIADPGVIAGSTRIAFRAGSLEIVDAVARLLPGIGAQNVEMDDGIYGERYYGVFFDDPDGNRLEVCVNP